MDIGSKLFHYSFHVYALHVADNNIHIHCSIVHLYFVVTLKYYLLCKPLHDVCYFR